MPPLRRADRLPVAAVFAIALLAAPFSRADDANFERGFSPEKVYAFGEVDSVNLFNGNLILTIPLGGPHPVGGGLSHGLKLVYNSNIWDFYERLVVVDVGGDTELHSIRRAEVSKQFNAGIGWTLSLGRLYGADDPLSPSTAGRFNYVGEDGSQHDFYPTLHVGEPATPSTTRYTRDGSYLRLQLSEPFGNGTYRVAIVESPDGTRRRFERASGAFSDGYEIKSITGAFGNQIIVRHPSATRWEIFDGHRTQVIHFVTKTVEGLSVNYVSEIELSAFGGATADVQFTYEDRTFDRHPAHQDTEILGTTVTAPMLTRVELPDGSSWRISQYHTTEETGPGLIQRLELPTLGKIDWTWRGYAYPVRSDGVGGGTLSLSSNYGVGTKTVLDAAGVCQELDDVGCTWTYTPGDGIARPLNQRVVTAPTGDETVHYFSIPLNVFTATWTGWEYGLPFTTASADGAGRFLSQEIYDGPAVGGVKKRSIYARYEHDRIPNAASTLIHEWYDTNRRVASEKTVYHDDGNRFAEVTHSLFDGLGHYRRSVTSGSFDAGNVRTTHTELNPARGVYRIDPSTNQPAADHDYTPWPSDSEWVLGTFTETSQSEGGVTAKQQYCFEASTGSLLRKRLLAGASPGAFDLLTVFTRDDAGNLIREQHYGGDVQEVGTGDLCTLELPSSGDQYRVDHTYSFGVRATSRWIGGNGSPLPFFTLQLTIDASTGLPSSAFDVSGLRTDFEYDGMGRLLWEKPEAGHGAWTEYVYSNASGTERADVLVRQRNGSKTGAILARRQFFFDAMGRLAGEHRLGADDVWRAKETVWNAMGWKHSVSEVGATGRVTTFEDYDPYGRPRRIVPPDGAAHQVDLSYEGVREVRRVTRFNAEDTLSATTERYDRQGRLFQVVEPSGALAGNVTTSYGYDVGGRLSAVFTADGGADTFQGRDFVYDHRGLLLRERHPEKGTSGNGWVRYLDYDALGNPGRKIDSVDGPEATDGAEVDLTFTYDRASRLTDLDAKGVIFKSFEYGFDNAVGDRRMGRLVRANRYNYVFLGATPHVVRIEETYSYGGPAGAVTARTTQAYLGDTAIEGFTQGWAYDPLGNVATLTYPRCTADNCNGASTTSRTVGFAYTNGWLTSVPDYASAISYHPNGMVHQVVHEDGSTYTQAADPDGMRRPASYTVTNSSGTPLWQSGAYAYDGSGNVSAIGEARFSYDAVSRLVSGEVLTTPLAAGGTILGQSAAYDAYGNLTALTTETGNCPDRVLTGETVIGARTETACGRLVAGPSYAVTGTGDLTLTAGRQVVLRDGFSVAAGGRLTVGTDPTIDDGATEETTLTLATDASTNRLTAQSYDDSGAMTSWNGNVYNREDLGLIWRLDAAGFKSIHLYTADDERVWTFFEGQNRSRWTLRDLDGKVLRELRTDGGSWIVQRDYVFRDGVPLAAVAPTGEVQHLHPDHLGTPRLVTRDGGGEPVQVAFHAYYPYGVEATAFDQDDERMKFTGHERDLGVEGSAADDVDYMHARYSNPQIGRFLSVDERRGNVRRPQTFNRYAYVSGNPLRRIDPDGLAELEFTIKTFIPSPSVTLFGTTFAGDARGFSFASGNYRTSQVLRIETDPVTSPNPLLSHSRDAGATHRLSPNPATAKANATGLTASGSRDAQGNANVAVSGTADNPLANPSASIDFNLTISASPDASLISVTGTQDGFPAMEIYVKNEQGEVTTVYQFDPASVDNGLGSLFPLVGDQSVDVNCTGVVSGTGNCIVAN